MDVFERICCIEGLSPIRRILFRYLSYGDFLCLMAANSNIAEEILMQNREFLKKSLVRSSYNTPLTKYILNDCMKEIFDAQQKGYLQKLQYYKKNFEFLVKNGHIYHFAVLSYSDASLAQYIQGFGPEVREYMTNLAIMDSVAMKKMPDMFGYTPFGLMHYCAKKNNIIFGECVCTQSIFQKKGEIVKIYKKSFQRVIYVAKTGYYKHCHSARY